MNDETKPMDEDEMMDLFGDGADTTIPEVIAEDTETPLEEDLLEQTPAEEQEVVILDETDDEQIEEMEEGEGEGTIILHPDNMQELANFIGEEQIEELAKHLELGDLEYIKSQNPTDIDNVAYYSPLASADVTPNNIKFLRSIMGDDAADLIQKVADIQKIDLEDLVRIRALPSNLNRIDVLDDSVGTAHFLQLFDDQGTDITNSIGLSLDDVGQLSVDTVFTGSAMTVLENGDKEYSPPTMGKSVSPAF